MTNTNSTIVGYDSVALPGHVFDELLRQSALSGYGPDEFILVLLLRNSESSQYSSASSA